MQKISMYDFLTMVVSGFLILLLFIPIKNLGEESILAFVACYILGMVYHKITECLYLPFRNCKYFLKKGYDSVDKEFYIKQKIPFGTTNYFSAYYCLMEKQCLNSIPVLEAQEAFIRNMMPILLVYIPVLCYRDSVLSGTIGRAFGEGGCLGGLLTVTLIFLIFVWYSLKVKISALVWDGYYFLHVKDREE